MFRKKKKPDKKRRSIFVDDLISDHSQASSVCELYVPEPSFKYDDFGDVKEICLSGDVQDFSWSKHCTVHICELPIDKSFLDQTLPFVVQDTGQDLEICLNITLNKQRQGDLLYIVRDEIWHECRQNNGTKWRTFVLRFDPNYDTYKEFQEKLNKVLQAVESPKPSEKAYILIAVQREEDKELSPTNKGRFTLKRDTTGRETSESSTTLEDKTYHSDSEQLSEEEFRPDDDNVCMEAPFDPAPYETAFTKTVRILKNFSREFPLKETKSQDRVSKLMQQLSTHCDSIHPSELPQTLESLLHSITTYSSDLDYTHYDPRSIDGVKAEKPTQAGIVSKIISDTNPRLLSEDISSECRYLPMGTDAKDKMTSENQENSKLANAQKLGELLAAAINDKDQEHAGLYAKQLAVDARLTVKVEVNLKPGANENLNNEFSLKVYIEDKESSGGRIMLKVRPLDTIRDLKNRMLMKHGFPVEVQNWIIGQRIPGDDETLAQCRVKSEGHSVYLYLVSATSVGLKKADFLMQQNFPNHDADYEIIEAFPGHPDPVQFTSGDSHEAQGAKKSGKSQQNKSKQDTKVPKDNLLEKYDLKQTPEKLQGKQPVFPGLDQTRNPRSQGQMRLPLQDNPPGRQQTAEQIRAILEQIKPDVAQAAYAAGIPPAHSRVPMMHPEESDEIGWSCKMCTFINKPTRPGCEVCGETRPKDYVIPEDYIVTEEELLRIQQEEEQERKTREVQTGGRKYDNNEERDLDNIIKFNDALQETLQATRRPQEAHSAPDISLRSTRTRRSPVEINSDEEES